MCKNSNLHAAKIAKNDEFYTQLADVEKEVKHYKDFFKGKKVLCNCNDDKWSAFFKYFTMNFEHLGLKQLVCISYNENGHGMKYTYNGDLNNNRMADDMEIVEQQLNSNGSYSSDECIELLKECDVVVTNPPFSLFRDFVALLIQYNKKFLIIGNGNAVTYKEIFPLIKENKMWIGHKSFSGGIDFIAGDNYDNSKCKHPKYDDKGNTIINVMMSVWFTNIPHNKRNQPLDLFKKYNPTEYPKYDNYDAIECSKTANIPMDYDGVIGVPITFLDKYCPTQFEIVGITENSDMISFIYKPNCSKYDRPYINGKRMYSRLLIKKVS